jgi:hypothetical protein
MNRSCNSDRSQRLISSVEQRSINIGLCQISINALIIYADVYADLISQTKRSSMAFKLAPVERYPNYREKQR